MESLDLTELELRSVNEALQAEGDGSNKAFEITNPRGSHAIAVGLDATLARREHCHHVLHARVIDDEVDVREVPGGLHDVIRHKVRLEPAGQG